MKRRLLSPLIILLTACAAQAQAVQDLERAIALLDSTMTKCFTGSQMKMYDLYDTSTHRGSGVADVWPYTAAIEATCSVLEALDLLHDEVPELYDEKHDAYVGQLEYLFANLGFYRGSYRLSSYAQRTTWSIYGVHRSDIRGRANVKGIENVYDDQMWLARELVRAYRLTGELAYLDEATMLTDYVLDGWDCCLDPDGNEYGGISWGPGYNSKHACSNAPIIQPLVWLYDIYRSPDWTDSYANIYTHRTIDAEGNRNKTIRYRSEVYLEFARKIYAWQKRHLLNPSTGVYYDMLGADNTIRHVTIGHTQYRTHEDTGNPGGTAFTYNTGTMLAGSAELYRVTLHPGYADDVASLTDKSFTAFTKWVSIDGERFRQFPTDDNATSGFNCWFNDVLMRAYVDAYSLQPAAAAKALNIYQFNLDYAYEHYLTDGFLPIDLLGGWGDSPVTKGFHQLAFASEYALLAIWQQRQTLTSPSSQPFVNAFKSWSNEPNLQIINLQ